MTRILRGRQPRPLGFSTYGQGIALGPRDAIGFSTYPNDRRSGRVVFTGRPGLWVRNFFVNLIRRVLFVERRFPGFFFWPGRGRGQNTVHLAGAPASLEDAA